MTESNFIIAPLSFSLPQMPMTAQEFLTADPDTLTPAQLAEFAEHWLFDEMPCHFCSSWVSRSYPYEEYRWCIECCADCESKFQESRRALPDVGKG